MAIDSAVSIQPNIPGNSLLSSIIVTIVWIYLMMVLICIVIKCVSRIKFFIDEPFEKKRMHHVYCNTDPCWERYRPNKLVAMDTERVGAGRRGSIDMLARVSLVDQYGQVLIDKFVKPLYKVTDYRTRWSGIRQDDLIDGDDFDSVRKLVAHIIEDRILIGHDLVQDLNVLHLSHPSKDIRDTAMYSGFRGVFSKPHEKPSLKYLARDRLQRRIQIAEHDSVEDARAAMSLYLEVAEEWEAGLNK